MTRRSSSDFTDRLAAIAIARLAPCWQASCLREEITTRAPCSAIRRAIARPMPREEPVTMATFPVRSNRDVVHPLEKTDASPWKKEAGRLPWI